MANDLIDNTPVCDAHPDYEQEYYRLMKEVNELSIENANLKDTIVSMCQTLFNK